MKNLFIVLLVSLVAVGCKTQKETTQQEETFYSAQTRSSNTQKKQGKGQKSGPPSIDEVFKMDTNNDGLLSKAEVIDSPLARNFDTIDSNNDGAISRAEFKNAPKPERRQRQGNR